MSHDNGATRGAAAWPLTNPWPLLIGGLVTVVLALMLAGLKGETGTAVRVALVVLGLCAAGGGVSLRLSYAPWDLDSRMQSAGALCLAALAALVGRFALDEAWDTARLVLNIAVAVSLAGAALVLLPQTARRVAVSLLVVFHFGGILTAATSVAPPSGQAPWLTIQLWTRVYRPYLQFMYLNNAYHFYSPEPGPPILLWFRVEYEGAEPRWIYLPERDAHATRLAYQRRLAGAEGTNQPGPPPGPDFELRWQRRQFGRNEKSLDNVRPDLRLQLSKVLEGMAAGDASVLVVPPYPNYMMQPTLQYRQPPPYSRLVLASYARHVARAYPCPDDPGKPVKAVKVYRVVHRMLLPGEFAEGMDPFDQTTFMPFYMGEFDRDGVLQDPDDPFLYWGIPIMRVVKREPGVPLPANPETEVKDYLKVHANLPTSRPHRPGTPPPAEDQPK